MKRYVKIFVENLDLFFQDITVFLNEYIYEVTEEEEKKLSGLRASFESELRDGGQPSIKELLSLASYLPLIKCSYIPKLKPPGGSLLVNELLQRQIWDFLKENEIKKEIAVLNEIENETSRRGRDQYEENPYPRWRYTSHLNENKLLTFPIYSILIHSLLFKIINNVLY